MGASDGDASRFGDKTLLGVFASFVAALAVYGVALLLTHNETVASMFAASAAGVPAAVEYRLQSKRRDPNAEAARLQQGELRRPVPLLVVMFVAAVFILDSVIGAFVGGVYGALGAMGVDIGVGGVFVWLLIIAIWSLLSAVVAGSIANYLGAHPYLWITVGMVIAAAIRILILLSMRFWGGYDVDPTDAAVAMLGYVACFAVSLVGVRIGLRYRARFIARELRRVQRKQPHASAAPSYTLLPPPNPRDRRLE